MLLFIRSTALSIILMSLAATQVSIAQHSGTTSTGSPLPSSLAWYAQIAKQRGQKTLILSNPETHDYTPLFHDTVKGSLLIEGTVTESAIDASDGFSIFHWYTIDPQNKYQRADLHTKNIPHNGVPVLRPNRPGELVVRVKGGTVSVDGVSITQPGPPAMEKGRSYLLFLTPTSEGFYELSFMTRPIPLDSAGKIDHASVGNSRFSRQLVPFGSFSDIRSFAEKSK